MGVYLRVSWQYSFHTCTGAGRRPGSDLALRSLPLSLGSDLLGLHPQGWQGHQVTLTGFSVLKTSRLS